MCHSHSNDVIPIPISIPIISSKATPISMEFQFESHSMRIPIPTHTSDLAYTCEYSYYRRPIMHNMPSVAGPCILQWHRANPYTAQLRNNRVKFLFLYMYGLLYFNPFVYTHWLLLFCEMCLKQRTVWSFPWRLTTKVKWSLGRRGPHGPVCAVPDVINHPLKTNKLSL